MRKFAFTFLMIAILAVGMFAPGMAGAHGPGEETAGAEGIYLLVDAEGGSVSVWEESNGEAGLQTTAHCHDAEGNDVACDADGAIPVPEDDKLA